MSNLGNHNREKLGNLPQKTNLKYLGLFSWSLYDWANSAFPTLVLTFIFATYFTESVAQTPLLGTSAWAEAVSLAGLLVALLAPLFGAIADYRGSRKPPLAAFTCLCAIASAMLWYTKPEPSSMRWGLNWLILGIIGYELGMVFYNAMLPHLAKKKYLGRLSGWAWGLGYLGGLTSLSLMLVFMNLYSNHIIRLTGPFSGLWLIVFSLPLFLWTPDPKQQTLPYPVAIKKGLSFLYLTFKEAQKNKEILKFLCARVLYIDALNTVFSFGGIYAAGTFGMGFKEVIEFGIAMNVSAGIGAVLFAWMDDLKGSKITILLSLTIMTVCTTVILFIHSKSYFWLFGLALSLCVGPIQSASRTLLIRLSPPELMTGMFGLYAFSGKATSFVGPWILAHLIYLFNSQRAGMSIVVVFLLLGALILCFVKEPSCSA